MIEEEKADTSDAVVNILRHLRHRDTVPVLLEAVAGSGKSTVSEKVYRAMRHSHPILTYFNTKMMEKARHSIEAEHGRDAALRIMTNNKLFFMLAKALDRDEHNELGFQAKRAVKRACNAMEDEDETEHGEIVEEMTSSHPFTTAPNRMLTIMGILREATPITEAVVRRHLDAVAKHFEKTGDLERQSEFVERSEINTFSEQTPREVVGSFIYHCSEIIKFVTTRGGKPASNCLACLIRVLVSCGAHRDPDMDAKSEAQLNLFLQKTCVRLGIVSEANAGLARAELLRLGEQAGKIFKRFEEWSFASPSAQVCAHLSNLFSAVEQFLHMFRFPLYGASFYGHCSYFVANELARRPAEAALAMASLSRMFIIDECQDMSKSFVDIVMACKLHYPKTQLLFLGDWRQNIYDGLYQTAGIADALAKYGGAWARIKTFKSYRVPKRVVNVALDSPEIPLDCKSIFSGFVCATEELAPSEFGDDSTRFLVETNTDLLEVAWWLVCRAGRSSVYIAPRSLAVMQQYEKEAGLVRTKRMSETYTSVQEKNKAELRAHILGCIKLKLNVESVNEVFVSTSKQGRMDVMTMHISKGLQFKNVVLLTQRTYPKSGAMAKQRNLLLYTAITRASNSLIIKRIQDLVGMSAQQAAAEKIHVYNPLEGEEARTSVL